MRFRRHQLITPAAGAPRGLQPIRSRHDPKVLHVLPLRSVGACLLLHLLLARVLLHTESTGELEKVDIALDANNVSRPSRIPYTHLRSKTANAVECEALYSRNASHALWHGPRSFAPRLVHGSWPEVRILLSLCSRRC